MNGFLSLALILAAALSWHPTAFAQWYESEDDVERDLDHDERVREAASAHDDQEDSATAAESKQENPSDEVDEIMGD